MKMYKPNSDEHKYIQSISQSQRDYNQNKESAEIVKDAGIRMKEKLMRQGYSPWKAEEELRKRGYRI